MTETQPSCKDRHHAQSLATPARQALWNRARCKDRKHHMLRIMAANAQVAGVVHAVRPGYRQR